MVENELEIKNKTFREKQILALEMIKKFYLGEWAREGYPEDAERGLRASLDIIRILEDTNPVLDQKITGVDGKQSTISISMVEKSCAGRLLIIDL